jgi:hypothetical protein
MFFYINDSYWRENLKDNIDFHKKIYNLLYNKDK